MSADLQISEQAYASFDDLFTDLSLDAAQPAALPEDTARAVDAYHSIVRADGSPVLTGEPFSIADVDAPLTIQIYLNTNTNTQFLFLNAPLTFTIPASRLVVPDRVILDHLFLRVRSDIPHHLDMATHYGTVHDAVAASIPATLNEILSHDTIDLRWARDAYWTGAAHITSAYRQYQGLEPLVRVYLFEGGLLAGIAGSVGCNQVQQCNLMMLAASLTIDKALYDRMWRELATLRDDAINSVPARPVIPQTLINTTVSTAATRRRTLEAALAGCRRAGTLLAEAGSQGDIDEAVARVTAVHRGILDLRAAIDGGEESSDSSDSSDSSESSSSDEEDDEEEEEDEDEDMPDTPAVNVAPVAAAAPAVPAAAAAPPPPGAANAQYRHTPGSPGNLDWGHQAQDLAYEALSPDAPVGCKRPVVDGPLVLSE
ncbi:hypothetical protein LTR99_005090 [Exophiala xenobiotica]|nr:hypothetical protein LTR72_002950 [Exophiala xenobiotica]KAK5234461.1 hypothetical protein LTR47_004494 [Exophiala xenobiotica]KAK5249806.1 hypothetical protein LTS06_005301 [Exophiala xenobiotica]KAK5270647.1 hypothetical protein LTR96_003924 [Exophiala xenobiotica]KAK5300711.1 hypothetical protein LTR14_001108 [Exophiala xenobiotica]